MKKFGLHFCVFILLPIALVALLFNTPVSLFLNNAAPVYELVEKTENQQLQTRTLLLGDSVCREFFEEKKNDTVYCLCENQSYEVPGNYLLLKSLLDNGSKFKKLKLIINPRTLTSSLNQKYTYNYFVKPFRDHLKDLESRDVDNLEQNFPAFDFLKFRFSNFEIQEAYDIYQNAQKDSLVVSEVNHRYLAKIDSICRANNIDFELIAPPLPKSTVPYLKKFNQETREQFRPYFESVIFYDSEMSKDGLHHISAEQFKLKNRNKLESFLDR